MDIGCRRLGVKWMMLPAFGEMPDLAHEVRRVWLGSLPMSARGNIEGELTDWLNSECILFGRRHFCGCRSPRRGVLLESSRPWLRTNKIRIWGRLEARGHWFAGRSWSRRPGLQRDSTKERARRVRKGSFSEILEICYRSSLPMAAILLWSKPEWQSSANMYRQ